jgi:hypothetical protein
MAGTVGHREGALRSGDSEFLAARQGRCYYLSFRGSATMKGPRAKKRFAVGARVRVLMPGINGVVTEVADSIGAIAEYWHKIETEDGERQEPGSNLQLIPRAIGGQSVNEAPASNVESEQHGRPLVFISHSSKDEILALALIELLKAGLGLVASQIRCSSVDGYRLPVGVNTERELREEVKSAKVVIGLITPNSLSSYFVMFELGARWGSGLFLAPLLAGVRPSELSGPLGLLNALLASNESQLHQFLENISSFLGLPLQSASSYLRQVATVKLLADGIPTNVHTIATTATEEPPMPEIKQVGSTNYYYLGDRGPYCQPCYDKNGKLFILSPAQEYAGGVSRKCEVCEKVFFERPPRSRGQVGGGGGPQSWMGN